MQFGNASTVWSAGGVQQGDPLGPSFLAAALQPLACELRAPDLAFSYLDDGVLAGDAAAVVAALRHVQTRGCELGLSLNLLKCELVVVGDLPDVALSPRFPRQILHAADGASRLQRSFELLGAPVGDEPYRPHTLPLGSKPPRPLLQALGELEDPQVGLRLLRSCAGHCKLIHSIRCSPLLGGNPGLQEFVGNH